LNEQLSALLARYVIAWEQRIGRLIAVLREDVALTSLRCPFGSADTWM